MQIVNKGMGGFLNPPNDAEHNWSVQDSFGRNAGSMSLRYALSCDYVPDSLKTRIRELLAEHSTQIEEQWVRKLYDFFAGCYSPDGIDRSVSSLVHTGPAEWHLAHLFIVQFFPEYGVRLDLIGNSDALPVEEAKK